MKTARKAVLALLLFVLILSLFAGCGQAAGNQTATSTAADSASVASETTAASTAAETTTLRFALYDYTLYNYDKEIVESFIKDNPNIKIDLLDTTNQQYQDKITVMLAGGEDIDVLYSKSMAHFGSMANNSQLMQLDDLFARDKIDTAPYRDGLDKFCKIDGRLYGMPYRQDFTLLYYNKDIFDKANEPYPTNDWTWDDYRATAKKLTSGEGNDKIWGAFIEPKLSLYEALGVIKGEGDLITGPYSQLKDGLTLLNDMTLVDKSAPDYATNKSLSRDQIFFEKGTSALFFTGDWMMNILSMDKNAGKTNINWGVVRLPAWKGMPQATQVSATPVVMNAKTTKKEAAWTLIKYISGEKGATIMGKNLMMPGYMSDSVIKAMESNPQFPKEGSEAINGSKLQYNAFTGDKNSGAINSMLNEEIGKIATNNISIDEGIANMEKRRKEIVEQNK